MRVGSLRIAALALVVLAVGSTRVGAATTPADASGLRGVVMRGPIKPVCLDDEGCDVPAPGVELQFRRDGRLVRRVETGAAGGYRVSLGPGRYTVRAGGVQRIGRLLTPAEVYVHRGRFAHVDFHIDTGIQ